MSTSFPSVTANIARLPASTNRTSANLLSVRQPLSTVLILSESPETIARVTHQMLGLTYRFRSRPLLLDLSRKLTSCADWPISNFDMLTLRDIDSENLGRRHPKLLHLHFVRAFGTDRALTGRHLSALPACDSDLPCHFLYSSVLGHSTAYHVQKGVVVPEWFPFLQPQVLPKKLQSHNE
jgi:hypothetical protein